MPMANRLGRLPWRRRPASARAILVGRWLQAAALDTTVTGRGPIPDESDATWLPARSQPLQHGRRGDANHFQNCWSTCALAYVSGRLTPVEDEAAPPKLK